MLFSIIIPVYNVSQHIEKCIDSVLSQSFSDYEVILINDGSKDDSHEKIQKYLDNQKIKYIVKENEGLSATRNRGIDESKGDYFIFLDSDDALFDGALENLSKFTGEDAIIAQGKSTDGSNKMLFDLKDYGVYDSKDFIKKAIKSGKTPMAAQLYIYKRKFLINNNLKFKTGILHEDEEFTPRALLKADKINFTDVVFYDYLIREGSITQSKDLRKNVHDFSNSMKDLEKLYLGLEDKELKEVLLNSLVTKYLSLTQDSKIYRYGKEYIEKDFVKRNSFNFKTKLKSILFRINPKIYWKINNSTKR